MKAIYSKPETKIFRINAERHLLAGSDLAVGNAYSSGDQVLSRRGGSNWDDEEEE